MNIYIKICTEQDSLHHFISRLNLLSNCYFLWQSFIILCVDFCDFMRHNTFEQEKNRNKEAIKSIKDLDESNMGQKHTLDVRIRAETKPKSNHPPIKVEPQQSTLQQPWKPTNINPLIDTEVTHVHDLPSHDQNSFVPNVITRRTPSYPSLRTPFK